MTTLAIFDRLVVGADRSPLDGATVEIRRESDNALASTYTDRAGTTPTSPQGTLTADSGGRATCYMPGGAYKVTVSKDAFSEVFRYVAHGTAGEQDYTDDPEYLSVRFTPTAETPDAEDGATYYPTSASQLGESNSSWVGEGPYTRVPMTAQGESPAVSTWRALANTGLWPAFEKTANTSITQFDGGRVLAMNSATATTVTFPAGVLRDDQVATLSGSAPCMQTIIVNRGTANVSIAVGSGVTFKSPAAFATVLPGRMAFVIYVRTGSGTANVYVIAGGEASTLAYVNTTSGLVATNVQSAIDELAGKHTVVKTDAEWNSSDLIMIAGQLGYASDTGQYRAGDGASTWPSLEVVGGDGHSPVTLNGDGPVTVTSDRTIAASDGASGLSSQELWLGRFIFVDASSEPVELTMDSALPVGFEVEIHVIDDTYGVTLKRPTVGIERDCGTLESDATITLANTADIAVGDVITGPGVVDSPDTTVISITPNTSVEASDVSTSDAISPLVTLTFTGQKGNFNGSQNDIGLLVGPSFAKVLGNSVGIDAEVLGSTNEGFGPILLEPEVGSFSIGPEHFGKSTDLNGTSSTQTVTFPTPVSIGAIYSGNRATTGILYAADLGATSYPLSTDGSTLKLPDGATASIIPGGEVRYRALNATTWSVVGSLASS